MEHQPTTIQEVIQSITESIVLASSHPLDDIGGYIVADTIANDLYDDWIIVYPDLEDVAESAAELETMTESSVYRDQVWNELLVHFERFKSKIPM